MGANNIIPPPAGLTDEEDRKLWLKSDSNSLLYFFTKSPKVRAKIQDRLDRGCCYYNCNGDTEQFYSGACRYCCMTYTCLFVPIFNIAMFVEMFRNGHSVWTDKSPLFEPKAFRKRSEWKKYVVETQMMNSQGVPKCKISVADAVAIHNEVLMPQIQGAGFNYEPSYGTGCCATGCSDAPTTYRLLLINRIYLDARWGERISRGERDADVGSVHSDITKMIEQTRIGLRCPKTS